MDSDAAVAPKIHYFIVDANTCNRLLGRRTDGVGIVSEVNESDDHGAE